MSTKSKLEHLQKGLDQNPTHSAANRMHVKPTTNQAGANWVIMEMDELTYLKGILFSVQGEEGVRAFGQHEFYFGIENWVKENMKTQKNFAAWFASMGD